MFPDGQIKITTAQVYVIDYVKARWIGTSGGLKMKLKLPYVNKATAWFQWFVEIETR